VSSAGKLGLVVPPLPPAMVLSAGLGTRLRPLTDLRAKPLVPVGDRPALAHVLGSLRAAGATRIVVNAHHHASQVAAFARALPWELRVSEEADLLGTSGGIAHARALLGEGDVLVWNGDILADVDVPALVASHVSRRGVATLVVQPLPAGQGPVGLDAQGCVVRLRTERFGDETDETRGGRFLGIYVLSVALRDRLVSPGGVVEDVLVPAMARGETVAAFELQLHAPWHDIGTVETYLAANLAWLDDRKLARWTAPGATVAPSVVLDRSLVGEGAVVTGQGTLSRCVVWPGAHAVAPLQDRVVTS
jgi:mannose-1-phosphate guanylyltransferase